MVTLKGLIGTFNVAKNPFEIIISKFTKKRREITFANGTKFNITWSQFRFLRDHYSLVTKYNLEQVSDESFRIRTERFQLVGSMVMMCIIDEVESGVYDYDYKGKVVLDVGGFEGESGVFFWSKGAKKVVIYEPVLEHLKFIQENASLNKMNAEIHGEGIGEKDGEITVSYDQSDNCFGLKTEESTNKMSIKIKDVTKAIAESNADIAKIDCEGAEISLIKVPKQTLRKLEYVMIEAHSAQIREALISKFKDSGFALKSKTEEDYQQISLLYFKRV